MKTPEEEMEKNGLMAISFKTFLNVHTIHHQIFFMENGLSFIFSAQKLKELAELADSHYVKVSMDFACGGIPNIKAITLKEDETEVNLAAQGLAAIAGCPYPPGCPDTIVSLNSKFNFL